MRQGSYLLISLVVIDSYSKYLVFKLFIMEKFVHNSYVVIVDKSFKMLLIQLFWTRQFSACHELIVLVR